MNIYFGRADNSEFDFSDLFEVERNGEVEYYYQALEFGTNPGGTDEVRIYDTCNRSVPISVDTIPQLVEALNHCYNMHEKFREAKEALERAETGAVAVSEEEWGDQYINYID